MTPLFQTARLRCRHWTRADVEAVYAIYADPVAMRWVGDGRPITREACLRWFDVTETNYRTRGYGMFALEEVATGQVVGCCGLVHPGNQVEVEIKYAFRRSHWGRGLASEVVPALLRHGHERHGLRRVIATVDADNHVSQKTLRRAGARVVQQRVEDDGGIALVFEWLAPSAGHATVPATPQQATTMLISPFEPALRDAVAGVILPIQQDEFGVSITLEDQPDLRDIAGFYQRGSGNFWVARVDGAVVGTIGLLDIGDGAAALRKMFVAAPYRGKAHGVAQRLLDHLLQWSAEHGLRRVYLGTTAQFLAAHRFYEKNGFRELPRQALPASFPVMAVDSRFYVLDVG